MSYVPCTLDDACRCPACYDRNTLVPDTRWQCPRCGRFVKESALGYEDWLDNGAWYGVSTRSWVDCPRCGRVDQEAALVCVKWTPLAEILQATDNAGRDHS